MSYYTGISIKHSINQLISVCNAQFDLIIELKNTDTKKTYNIKRNTTYNNILSNWTTDRQNGIFVLEYCLV